MACSSQCAGESVIRDVLANVERDGTFAINSARANLAKQAAKFLLAAEQATALQRFAQKLYQVTQNIVVKVKSRNYKSFATTESRLWSNFHEARGKVMKETWNQLWRELGEATAQFKQEQALMQHCNTKVFEEVIKNSFVVEKGVVHSSMDDDLMDEEENALYYVAGYIIRAIK